MTSVQPPQTDHRQRPEISVGIFAAFGAVGTTLGLWVFRLPFWLEIPVVAVVVLSAGFLFCRAMERRYPDHPFFARQRRARR